MGERGAWRQIGETGVWVDTLFIVVVDDQIVSLDKLGDLWATDARTSTSRRINDDKYTHSRFLFGASREVYNIDQGGTLSAPDVATGAWRRIGDAGAYAKVRLVALAGDHVVTVGQSGGIYVTNPAGECRKLCDDLYDRTVMLFDGVKHVYALENNSIFAVETEKGNARRLGGAGDFANTKTGAGAGDKIYTLEGTGVIWETDGETGHYQKVGKETFLDTRLMTAGNDHIYTVEPTGNLYEICV